jgi:S-DNA-T family DNA segregation ATPase FtsK/SpoIIIE
MRATLRHELTGIVLALLAVFVAGALLLQPVPDEGSCWAVRGVFGPVGSCLKWGLRGLVGLPAAWLLPLAAGVHALRLLGRLGSGPDRSWMIFLLGVAVLLPVGIGLAMGGDPDATSIAGLWGSFVAFYVQRFFGSAGAWFVLALLLSALMAWTLSWNPIRAIVGPSPGKSVPVPEAPTLAQKLEPPPQDMPAVETGLGETPEPTTPLAERKRAKKPAVADSDVGVVGASDGGEDTLPPPELLTLAPTTFSEASARELEEMGQKLMDALRTFRVDGELVGRTTGPVVTQYEIEPAPGVKVRQFANLANDLALAMRAQSIRVVAPIPGRGAVGVEVPNPTAELVWFRKLIESREFQSLRASLPIALGEDLEGRPVVADLARMPHLLIAGATGSGKSVCVNTIVTSLVYRHTPETLRFLMVDPKMVELSVYNRLPHLRYRVVTDNRDAASMLKWAVMEMHDRYHLLAANGRATSRSSTSGDEGASLQLRRTLTWRSRTARTARESSRTSSSSSTSWPT